MKPQPLNLFADTAQDMPLFSGTPQTARINEYKPQEATQAYNMFAATCKVCYGTKTIKNKGKLIPCMYCNN